MARFGLLFLLSLALGAQAVAQHSCQEARQGNHHGLALKNAASRSDSIDLLHKRISLDLTLPDGIAASCRIRFTPLVAGIGQLPLDLLALSVDSVTQDGQQLNFTHAGELLDIELVATLGPGDTVEVDIHYRGSPATDPSGFGGFYLDGIYRYNLGVAFESIPHSYGRAWFPCFDDFVQRSSYEFIVTTHDGRRAWCNGTLLSETALGGDTIVRHWRIDESLPAYLASVAAAPYVAVHDTFPSLGGGTVPVELVALPGDTTNMKSSFIHLQQAFDHFEERFGTYTWNKVGYVLTPLGAMEHSTSIHYPRVIANGNLVYEAVMAHELAHEWFGNLITCERAEEMYLNEGFAEFLSFLFLEAVHGRERYMDEVRSNHREQVHRAHLRDEGHHALSEVPQAYTYGSHVYNKGADVLHTLRSYMGDSLFDLGLRSFLQDNAFRSVNSVQLRDQLGAATGMDLSQFFTDWIFQPGWAAFEVDAFSAQTDGGGQWTVTAEVEQKLRGADTPYFDVPVSLACRSATGELHRETVVMGGWNSTVQLTCPFEPVQLWLNDDDRISLAISGQTDTITTTGLKVFSLGNVRFTTTALGAPVPLRVDQYWVAADEESVEPDAIVVSPDRWWRIGGELPVGSEVSMRITVDGRPTISGSLDLGLVQDHDGVTFHEDSLLLLFRSDASQPWAPMANAVISTLGPPTDGHARVDVPFTGPGDFTLGFRKAPVGISHLQMDAASWGVAPNPARDHVRVSHPQGQLLKGHLQAFDQQGREVFQAPWHGTPMVVPLEGIAPGVLHLRFTPQGAAPKAVGRVVVEGRAR